MIFLILVQVLTRAKCRNWPIDSSSDTDEDPAPVDYRQRVYSFLEWTEPPRLGVLRNLQCQTRLELILRLLKKRVLERAHMSYPFQVFIFHCSHFPSAAYRQVSAVRKGGAGQHNGDEQKQKLHNSHHVLLYFKEWEALKESWKGDKWGKRETKIGGILQLASCVCLYPNCLFCH